MTLPDKIATTPQRQPTLRPKFEPRQRETALPSKIATVPRQPNLRPNWDCATTGDHVTIQNGHRNLSLPLLVLLITRGYPFGYRYEFANVPYERSTVPSWLCHLCAKYAGWASLVGKMNGHDVS